MKKNIQDQINKIQASISFIFIGSLSLYQGIEALSRYFLNNEIDFYGLAILTVGAFFVILGEISFLRAKKKIMLLITLTDSDKSEPYKPANGIGCANPLENEAG